MDIFQHHEIVGLLQRLFELQERSERYDREMLHELREIRRELKPKPVTASIAIHFSGASMNNALVLNVGQTSQASILPLLADGTTNSGGVPSDVAFNFSDPSATVALNPDGVTATVTGVAPSSGPVSGNVTCTITDTDGVISKWTQPFTIETDAVPPPPQQLTQSIAVEFSTPTP